jgi:hypothetical protein
MMNSSRTTRSWTASRESFSGTPTGADRHEKQRTKGAF